MYNGSNSIKEEKKLFSFENIKVWERDDQEEPLQLKNVWIAQT